MHSRTRTELTIDQIEVSRFNVRRNHEDQHAVAPIAESILQRGLIHPIQVHPLHGSKGRFGAYAGGRRYRAHRQLIADGRLPKDHAIKVEILEGASDAELVELSAIENMQRRDLHPYEEVLAIKRARDLGHTIDQVAHALGQTVLVVKRAIRLAELAPPVFDAFEHGRITMDQARAFGATSDREAQEAAWKQLAGAAQALSPRIEVAAIRKALRIGDPTLDKLLRFVGEDAYRAAGGGWDQDLFAGEGGEPGRLTAEGKLRAIADAKLDAYRADLRRRAGRELRFVAEAPRHPDYKGTDDFNLRVHPPVTDGPIELPPGDVVGLVTITPAGEPEVAWYYASRRALAAAETAKRKRKAASPAPRSSAALAAPAGPVAREAAERIRDQLGGTRSVQEIFRSIRRAVLRAGLLLDADTGGTAGLDLLVWSQCRLLLSRDPHLAGRIGVAELPLVGDPAEATPHLLAIPAQRKLDGAHRALAVRPWAEEEDLALSFRLFQREPRKVRNLAAALVAGAALQRSVRAEHFDSDVHQVLAEAIGVADNAGVRVFWTPTPELLGLIQRDHRLAIAEPYVESATFGAWRSLNDGELTAMVVRVVTGAAAALRRSMAAAAAEWVHPLLGFDPPPPALAPSSGDNDPAELAHAEAAE